VLTVCSSAPHCHQEAMEQAAEFWAVYERSTGTFCPDDPVDSVQQRGLPRPRPTLLVSGPSAAERRGSAVNPGRLVAIEEFRGVYRSRLGPSVPAGRPRLARFYGRAPGPVARSRRSRSRHAVGHPRSSKSPAWRLTASPTVRSASSSTSRTGRWRTTWAGFSRSSASPRVASFTRPCLA